MIRWYPGLLLALLFAGIFLWVSQSVPSYAAILLFAVSALSGRAIVGVLRSVAIKRQLLDFPNERSSHSFPTPRGGGLAIAVLSIAAAIVAPLFFPAIDSRAAMLIAVTAAVVATIGFWDDVASLGTRIRLLTHILAAAIITAMLGPVAIARTPTVLSNDHAWLGYLLAMMWIVGLTNAYNFMDGIDGIAAGQAVIASLGWAVVGAISSNGFLVIVGLTVAGASAGFLWHNWPPARIFMGDVGSGFLGFLFAAMTLLAAQDEPRAIFAGVLFVWPFVFDSTLTFIRRLYGRENVFVPHRSHLYQRLVIAGASHSRSTTIYAAVACICAATGIAFYAEAPGTVLIGPVVLIGAGVAIYVIVMRAERRSGTRPNQ